VYTAPAPVYVPASPVSAASPSAQSIDDTENEDEPELTLYQINDLKDMFYEKIARLDAMERRVRANNAQAAAAAAAPN
jgi:hypothetical protein